MSSDLNSIWLDWRAKVPNGVPNPSNAYHLVLLKELCEKKGIDKSIVDNVILSLEKKAILQEATIASVRDKIIKGLGGKLGLAGPKTAKNITSTKGTDSNTVGKEVGKLLNTKVYVMGPGESAGGFKNSSSKFDSIGFEYEGKNYEYKLSLSTAGAGIPGNAAWYESGICVEYNKLKGSANPFKDAKVDEKDYSQFAAHLTEVCAPVAKNIGNVGSRLEQTGGDRISPSSEWPTSEGTPKTDIYGGSSHRLSVKKEAGSQLSSGGAGDSKGIFEAAKTFYESHEKSSVNKVVDDLIGNIDKTFKKYNTDNSVGAVRKSVGEAYFKWRVPQIDSEVKKLKLKKVDTKRHAKAELMAVGIIGEAGNWNTWYIEGVKVLNKGKVLKWVSKYVKSLATKELQDEAKNIVTTAIDHKAMQVDFDKAFQDKKFKKWAVYEAGTGNFKFSGDSNLNSDSKGIANEMLIFNLKGMGKIISIDESWASKYASKVSTKVGYKSSARSKFTAFRLLSETNEYGEKLHLKEDLTPIELYFNDIIEEELETFNDSLDSELSIITESLDEGMLGDTFKKLKNIGKTVLKKIMDFIKKFFSNIFTKIIAKLKEYGKKGITSLSEVLGITIDGSADLVINF